MWATANLTGNWNNNDQKESHRKKKTLLWGGLVSLRFTTDLPGKTVAIQVTVRENWPRPSTQPFKFSVGGSQLRCSTVKKVQSDNNLCTKLDNFGCTKLRCWQLRALPQHAHDLKAAAHSQNLVILVAIHGNPQAPLRYEQMWAVHSSTLLGLSKQWVSQLPGTTPEAERVERGYSSKLWEKNLKAGTSSFLKNFCMMFSSTWRKSQSFPASATECLKLPKEKQQK